VTHSWFKKGYFCRTSRRVWTYQN